MNLTYNFTGQTAIVTGGVRGIGKAISEAFLKAGGNVIATYVSNDEAANSFKKENQQYSDLLSLEKFDVADYHSVEDFFKKVEEKYSSFVSGNPI
ncbi:MAG: SDR family NAD(P)-dependent oxidoreductase [Nitrospinae bacterium]|nr:SDR family NAD(P)-dependent oxidoreductase [Nitrospinota bacterium]